MPDKRGFSRNETWQKNSRDFVKSQGVATNRVRF